MKTLQRLAISRPIATSMVYLGIIMLGIMALVRMELNLLPRLEIPRLTVVTFAEGLSPQETESLVTRPLSEGLGTVSGLRRVVSESLQGISIITIEFRWGTSLDFAVMDVREKLEQARAFLPERATRPVINRFDPAASPVMEIVFTARDPSEEKAFRHFIKNDVKPFLEQTDGVAQVDITGGFEKEIEVLVDGPALAAYALSLTDLAKHITQANVNTPAGHITVGDKDVLIRTLGEFKQPADIGKIVVARSPKGAVTHLEEIATISDGFRERTSLARYNGVECVLVSLRKEAGKNTVQVADNALLTLKTIDDTFGKKLQSHVVYNESQFIRNSLNNIGWTLVLGAILAFGALLLILRNLKSPLILVTVIPVSILATFLLMFTAGLSLNMMSLGGIGLGIGMLFDSGNVVLSAIERYRFAGYPAREAALKGATEVTGSVFAAIATTVIVFLPVIFIKSIVGIVFAEMGLTITFSLIVSLIVSLTLIPMLSALDWPDSLSSPLTHNRFLQAVAHQEQKIQKTYKSRLTFFLDHPWRLFRPALIAFGLSLVGSYFLEREFVPRIDSGQFVIEIRNERGSSVESTTEIAQAIEEFLTKEAPVAHVVTAIGYERGQLTAGGDAGTHFGRLRVVLLPGSNTARIVNLLRSRLKFRESISVSYLLKGDMLTEILAPDARAITLEVIGDEVETLKEIGGNVISILEKIDGVVDISSNMQEKSREYHIAFDHARTGRLGTSIEILGTYLQTALDGSLPTRFRLADDEIDVRIRLSGERKRPLSDVHELRIPVAEQRQISLSEIAYVKEESRYPVIMRSGPSRINRITADMSSHAHNAILAQIDSDLEGLKLPGGYSVRYAGERENMRESFAELGLAFLLAIVMIYMILSAQTESLRISGLMLISIPFILTGVVPALLMTGTTLNVSTFTGIILLVGVVVDNAALYREYVFLLREEGMSLREALLESGQIVMKPLLMNNSTTMLALLPAALGIGQGLEFQGSMARAVIAGLFAAGVLSLFVIPLAFQWLLGPAQSGEADG